MGAKEAQETNFERCAMDFGPKTHFEKKKLSNLLKIAEISVFLKIQRSVMWPHDSIGQKLATLRTA